MAKKISEKDIFQGDIFAKSRKSAQEYIKVLKAVENELKEMLKVNQQILKQSSDELKNTEAIKKRATAINEVRKQSKALGTAEQERIRTERELQKLEQDRQRTRQATNRTIVQERKEEERLAKIKAKNLKQARQENSAYAKQSKRLNELRKRYKDLAVQNKQNTEEGRKLLRNIQQLDTKLKQVDKSVGQSQRNVGNYTSAWGKLGARLKSVASAFGLVGGVMGAVMVVKNVFNVIKDFDQAMADLGSISGKTADQIAPLRQQAIELGESTRFTASEIVGLQIELAKLGFSIPEIQNSTEAISNLSAATGTELASAAKIAGSTLRAFNLDASEMDRVASTLGVATTKSALNMEFLETAMSKVAPVSSALGFSLEDSTALLGTLANAGFDASTAATSTRNILLKLADSSGDLAQVLGRPITSLEELAPALKELDDKGINLAQSLELTDKRSVAAFNTFLKGTETMVGLRDSITDVNKELDDMAKKQLNTVSGQLALLNSKWQGLILGMGDSTNATDKLKNAIQFLTRNLKTILNSIYLVVKGLVVWKSTQIALNVLLRTGKLLMKSWTFLTNAQARATALATAKTKMFNTAIKSNPLGLLITALTTAIALLWEYGQAVDYDAEATSKLNKELDQMRQKASQNFEELESASKVRVAQLELEIAKLKQKGATEQEIGDLQKQIDEEYLDRQREKIADENSIVVKLEDDIYSLSKARDQANSKQIKDQQKLNKLQKAQQDYMKEHPGAQVSINQAEIQAVALRMRNTRLKLKELNASITAREEELEKQQAVLEQAENELEIQKLKNEASEVESKITDVVIKKGKTKVYNTSEILRLENELNRLLEDRLKILNEIRNEERSQETKEIDVAIKKEMELLTLLAESQDFVRTKQKIDFDKIRTLINQKYNLQKIGIDEQLNYEITALKKSNDLKKQQWMLDIINYQNKLDADVKNENISRSKAKQLLIDYKNGITKLVVALDEKEKAKLEELELKAFNDKKNLDQEKIDQVKQTEDEITDLYKATADSIITADKAAAKKANDLLVQRLQAYREFTQQIIQLIDKQTDAKLQAIDKELQASEKREDELRQLAIKGTNTASDSLAAEQQRQAELERQKEELERKKLRRQAILSGLDLLTQKLEDDDADAVTSTIRDMTRLIAILSNLPAFAEGTEFIERGTAPKGKDRILARVNEGERILTTDQNKQIGDLSNEELTSIAKDYNNGVFQDVNYMKPKLKELHQPYQSNEAILTKFDELKRTIENKPMLTEVRWDEISKMIIEKVETKNKIVKRHTSSNRIF